MDLRIFLSGRQVFWGRERKKLGFSNTLLLKSLKVEGIAHFLTLFQKETKTCTFKGGESYVLKSLPVKKSGQLITQTWIISLAKDCNTHGNSLVIFKQLCWYFLTTLIQLSFSSGMSTEGEFQCSIYKCSWPKILA